jgi:hypothetical protein
MLALALVSLSPLLARPAAAQSSPERLQIFGHLTQAFAGSSEAPILGVPDGLTTDYRSAALQLRYALTPSSNVVIQASHRRLGMSPVARTDHDLELDWAFYQHLVGGLRVRVGRVPITMGIYNEIRDVGTLLPFYRAPASVYPEGTEAVDGLTLGYAHYFADWSVEANVFGGATGYLNVTQTPVGPFVLDEHWEGTYGTQLWLGTPVEGLRVGASLLSLKLGDGIPLEARERIFVWVGSLDADFDRHMVRGEYLTVETMDNRTERYYAHGALDLTSWLQLAAQAEIVTGEPKLPAPAPKSRLSQDYALGLSYRVRSDLVLKLEGHRAKGYAFDMFVDPTGPALATSYAIASIAVTF